MLKISNDGWWMVHSTVRPLLAMRFTARITTRADRESSPDVGSSRNSTLGLAAISTPMVTRLRCSTDRPVPDPPAPGRPMILLRIGRSSTRSMTALTISSLSASVLSRGRRCHAENRSASSTVCVGTWMSVCSTYPLTCENGPSSCGCPLSRIDPEISPPVLRPATTSMSVDLPAPEEPMRAVMVPGLNTASMLLSSGFHSVPLPPSPETLTL
mmetsp:Transcript_27105/g.54546  ORF Transcript_27105/g.54546 Transcript_27105/m.54546 type:complete len:213 (-) Transcript_27105:175-813(-)